MAAKSKKGPVISGRVPSKKRGMTSKSSAAAAKTMRSGRAGRRTTLRVPAALESEISRAAKELEISENEALIRLAQLGAATAKRQRDVRRVVGRRQAAVAGAGSERGEGALPSPEEMQAAILAARD
jgi:hypothetical protein